MDYSPTGIVCVTGATGFMAASLIKRLLDLGFIVNATIRESADEESLQTLKQLTGAYYRLRLFKADLLEPGSFNEAVFGCDGVFHVACPMNLEPVDPHSEVIEPAIKGTLNVMESCWRAATVKRLVLTSCITSMISNDNNDENDAWTDVEQLEKEKPLGWAYLVSKLLAEKAALKYAEEKELEVLTVLPALMLGASIMPSLPYGVVFGTCFLLNEDHLNLQLKGFEVLKAMENLCGWVCLVHVEDAVNAHVRLFLDTTARGRYACCGVFTKTEDLVNKYKKRACYENSNSLAPRDMGRVKLEGESEHNVRKNILLSTRLVGTGFSFKYNSLDSIYQDTISYLLTKGIFL